MGNIQIGGHKRRAFVPRPQACRRGKGYECQQVGVDVAFPAPFYTYARYFGNKWVNYDSYNRSGRKNGLRSMTLISLQPRTPS